MDILVEDEDSVFRNADEIAHAVAQGKRDAETRFVTRFRPGVLRLLERLTGDSVLAEDLTHDTMIVVLQKLRNNGLRDANKLSSYAYQTARYLYFCWLRKSSSRLVLLGSLDNVESGVPLPEHQLLSEIDREHLRRSINDLKVARDREILMRHYVHEQSKPEICEALVLSSQHFDRVISRARHRLKEGLKESFDPVP
jgi:RNA polymerase sigma-70 factor (ECF subfamily)